MKEKKQKITKPAVLFGEKTAKRIGYIDNYIFACEIEGEDHIVYSKPRRPKYHLVIIVMDGYMNMVINGERYRFEKKAYVNLPTWADIYEIEYGGGFHAMTTAADKSIIEDIFRNRNPFPIDFQFRIDHGLGGYIEDDRDLDILCRDISNMIESLSNKKHLFAEEINYVYVAYAYCHGTYKPCLQSRGYDRYKVSAERQSSDPGIYPVRHLCRSYDSQRYLSFLLL